MRWFLSRGPRVHSCAFGWRCTPGKPRLRDEGGYVGLSLNRCARIRAIGHGGQVLLSAATSALVIDRLPSGATLLDLGVHRLKDLGRPEHVWELVHPDLPSEFASLRSLNAFRHNLPVQLTPLIGRGRDIGEVTDLIAGERLVTLLGSAGVGKSRLALAIAAEVLDSHPGGVWFVELAPLADPQAIAGAALAALGVHEAAGAQLTRQLAVELGTSPCLVVFDNCEHLVEGCAELIAGLLAANPSVSVIATSREPLGVPGEITWRVPSLATPPPERTLDVPSLSQYDAVRLFVDRARRARPSFVITDTNAPAVAQVCHRLDGIPLAIELAAARCRQMTADRIAAELDDRFRLLTGGARTVMARQQTLAASVDWSHDLLDDVERIVFRRLGVFAGPFPLEAADAVVADLDDVESVAVFDLVSRLVDKSLVVVEDSPDGQPRYRLLETLRVYALDQARTAGELVPLRQAHARWWAEWLDQLGADDPTDDAVDQISAYYDNLKSALDWSVDEPELGLRLLASLARPMLCEGRTGGALAVADRLLLAHEPDVADRPAWLRAATRAPALYYPADRIGEIAVALEHAQHLVPDERDEDLTTYSLWPRSYDPAVEIALRERARQHGDRWFETLVTCRLAWELSEEDPDAATAELANADDLAAASRNSFLQAYALIAHALHARATGDLHRCIEICRTLVAVQPPIPAGYAVAILSMAALYARDHESLQIAVDASHQAARKAPTLALYATKAARRWTLLSGEQNAVDRDLRIEPEPTGSNLTTPSLWLATREAINIGATDDALAGARRHANPRPHRQAVLAAIEAAASGHEEHWHVALNLAVHHGLRLIAVNALEGLATTAAAADSWQESARLLSAADRLREETGYRWRFTCEQRAVDSAVNAARSALGEQATVAFEAGHNLDWHDAATYASRARGERKRPNHGWPSLTPTEQQVVALIAEGLTNPQIAERLLMGRATVKSHLEHVFTKLGVRTRSELAAQATRQAHP